MYTENNLVRLAKRENNTKRKYLVVNRLQGKHIPVAPSKAIEMFTELSGIVKTEYPDERLLLIGFAETATAIGAAAAVYLDSYYMQTTREVIPDVEYLFFSESHSHATEQKLVKNDIDSIIDKIDRIVFIEDEVTTGNTIMNIINVLKSKYKESAEKINYSVASILNGMNQESQENYKKHNISVHYLVKTEHDTYESMIEHFKGDGEYKQSSSSMNHCVFSEHTFHEYINARRLVKGSTYGNACATLWNHIRSEIDFSNYKRILFLGTEEFMYPALHAAYELEKTGKEVYFHATTRSPIVVSSESDYPLHKRFELLSLYDSQRTTFVYDLNQYDLAVLITDAAENDKSGQITIMDALQKSGNTNICVVRWQ